MRAAIMTVHVCRKFPDQIEAIRKLVQRSEVLRDICTDYEEICSWLADCTKTKKPPSKEYDRALEVQRDLEKDILRILKEAGY